MTEPVQIGLILAATYLIADRGVWAMIRLGPRLGLIDHPDERRIHVKPIPRAGGIGVFVALISGLAMLWWGGLLNPSEGGVQSKEWLKWFSASACLLVIVGILDDRFDIPAWWKLLGQVAAATVMFFGSQEQHGVLMGVHVPVWLDWAVYIAWTVALVNAFNLIDGMDGLCAGLGLISTGTMCVLAMVVHGTGTALVLAVMCMSLLGFLRFNFHPAKIFLGDTGSMLVGYFIAVAGGATVGKHAVIAGVLMPVLVAGIPLFDVILAVWRRLARRLAHAGHEKDAPKVFGADKDHLHHRLLNWGFTQRQTVSIMYGVAVVLSVVALAPFLGGGNWLAISFFATLVIGLVGLRYIAPVEFIETNSGLRAFLRKPGGRLLGIALAYFILDLVVLLFAGWGSTQLMEKTLSTEFSRKDVLSITLVFTGSLLVCLRFSHAHTRRWSRAGIFEFAQLMAWVLGGTLLSFGLISVLFVDIAYRVVQVHFVAFAIAIVGTTVPRCISRLAQEGRIDATHRRREIDTECRNPTLLYGAADIGELFLCHLRLSPPEKWSGHSIVGFLDDQKGLRGRRLRGFPVLGGKDRLEAIVKRHKIRSIILTTGKMDPENLEELAEQCRRLNVELLQWNPILEGQQLVARKPKTETG
ncbi:MAG: hypothetical protein AAGI48_09525 [Verrucomicrobiota bacterium]